MSKAKKLQLAKSDTAADRSPARTTGTVQDLKTRMDRLFDEWMGGSALSPLLSSDAFAGWDPWPSLRSETGRFRVPPLDLVESNGTYTVTMELPGVAEEDIDVSVARGVLSVRGEKKEETHDEADDQHVNERRYGSFQRSIRLPDGVDDGKAKASFDKGVLKITLPKTADAPSSVRKIKIA